MAGPSILMNCTTYAYNMAGSVQAMTSAYITIIFTIIRYVLIVCDWLSALSQGPYYFAMSTEEHQAFQLQLLKYLNRLILMLVALALLEYDLSSILPFRGLLKFCVQYYVGSMLPQVICALFYSLIKEREALYARRELHQARERVLIQLLQALAQGPDVNPEQDPLPPYNEPPLSSPPQGVLPPIGDTEQQENPRQGAVDFLASYSRSYPPVLVPRLQTLLMDVILSDPVLTDHSQEESGMLQTDGTQQPLDSRQVALDFLASYRYFYSPISSTRQQNPRRARSSVSPPGDLQYGNTRQAAIDFLATYRHVYPPALACGTPDDPASGN